LKDALGKLKSPGRGILGMYRWFCTMPALIIKMRMFNFLDLPAHVGPMGLLRGPVSGWGDQ
jgi:hypothetical protein